MNKPEGLYLRLFGKDELIVFHKPVWLAFNKDTELTMLFEAMIFWCDKSHRTDGWFWHSRADWESELGISSYVQRKCEDHLVALGLIQVKLMRANGAPTTHYKINHATVVSWLKNVAGICSTVNASVKNPTVDNEKFDNPPSNISQSLTVNLNTVNLKDSQKEKPKNEPETKKRGRPPKDRKAEEKTPLHPSLLAYRTEARRHIPITWREEVIATVGDRVDEWRKLVHSWIGKGYNPGNIADMLAAFRAGGLRSNGNGSYQKRQPVRDQTIEQAAMVDLESNFAAVTADGFRVGSSSWYQKYGAGSISVLEAATKKWKEQGVENVPAT